MTGRNGHRRRAGTRACAAGACALLAIGVGGFVPAAASSQSARTTKADNSTCTTNDSPVWNDQSATPWEISYANTQSSAQYGTGSGVKVAIIDTGIVGGNSQLSPVIAGGQDFSKSGGVYKADVDGHGTFVASIIAAQKSDRNGMVGIAPGVKLLIYREAGCNVQGGNREPDMADAINAAVAAGARVINISQAGYVPDDGLKAAVVNAYRKNVLVVVAAGNFGNLDAHDPNGSADYGINPTTYPAAYVPYVLTVGAVNQDGGVAGFSETGPFVSVTAPGVGVGGLFPDGKIHHDDGTSFAAPYVSAVAALLIAKHPDWSVQTIMRVLEATASGNGSWNPSQGWGEVSATAALTADPTHLTGLYGAGPNADGPARAKPVSHGIPMLPIVNAAPGPTEVNQRKGAYIALGSAILIVIVTLAGTFIARDARRRRMTL
jgi:type VII secretion-associated serine protease mycosin